MEISITKARRYLKKESPAHLRAFNEYTEYGCYDFEVSRKRLTKCKYFEDDEGYLIYIHQVAGILGDDYWGTCSMKLPRQNLWINWRFSE